MHVCYLLTSQLLTLSLIPGRGDGSPPRSSPGSSIGVLGCFDSGDLAMTPAAPGRVLGSVAPDVTYSIHVMLICLYMPSKLVSLTLNFQHAYQSDLNSVT